METLEALGEHAAPHVEAIAARLEHENRLVRMTAVYTLGALREHAVPHVGPRVLRGDEELMIEKDQVLNVIGALDALYRSAEAGSEVRL